MATSDGKSAPASRQSVQPSRQTSESLLMRPSAIHLRITSPRAGPYCPPLGGRTYHTAFGASAIGSAGVAGGEAGAVVGGAIVAAVGLAGAGAEGAGGKKISGVGAGFLDGAAPLAAAETADFAVAGANSAVGAGTAAGPAGAAGDAF